MSCFFHLQKRTLPLSYLVGYVFSTAIPVEICIGCQTVKAKGPISLNRTSDSTNSASCKAGFEGAVVTPSADEIFLNIAWTYQQNVKPSTRKEFNDFLDFLVTVKGLLVSGFKSGSLLITVKCTSLQVLEELWTDYTCGHLNEVVQEYLVTEDILTDLGLAELKLKTTIKEEDYKECKQVFQELGWFKNYYQVK